MAFSFFARINVISAIVSPNTRTTPAINRYLKTVESLYSAFVRFVKTIGDKNPPMLGAMLVLITVAVAELEASTSLETEYTHLGSMILRDVPAMKTPMVIIIKEEENTPISKYPIKSAMQAITMTMSPNRSESLPKNKPETTPPPIKIATKMPEVAELPRLAICVEILVLQTE